MRRMIPSNLIDWIKSLKDKFIHNSETNTIEFGGNVEIDGNIQLNGRLKGNEPLSLSMFGVTEYDGSSDEKSTIYSKEQIIEILKENINNLFYTYDSTYDYQNVYFRVSMIDERSINNHHTFAVLMSNASLGSYGQIIEFIQESNKKCYIKGVN